MSDVVTPADLQAWVAGLDEMFARVAGRFGRVEPRRQARAYVRGLLAPVERKNGWQLAQAAGDTTPDKTQRLLNHARWDADQVRDDLRDYVVDRLGDDQAVLIVDETGFLKKGTCSAGVQRQYSGTAGRIENCQIGVFVGYATDRGRALIDRELYLPRSWLADPVRCRRAAIPGDAVFATKAALGLRMLHRALDAGVAARWVTADEVYGQDFKFRHALVQRGLGYVVAVPRSQSIGIGPHGNLRAEAVVAEAPEDAWHRRSAGDGAKGQRFYDWAMADLIWLAAPGYEHRLLVRRSLTDPDGLAFYLCHCPTEATLEELVTVAGRRWAIEECFQVAKNEVGLDHYQVRRWDAWYRHITLSMLAAAYLTVTAARAPKAAVVSSPSPRPRSAVCWHT